MRPVLVEGMAQVRAKALVLGSGSSERVAQKVARQLIANGYEAKTATELGLRLPRNMAEPDAMDKLKAALQEFAQVSGAPVSAYAHCIHPGTSFWATRPELSQIGQALGLNVLSPSTRVVSLFGNKLNLISEAARLEIPNLLFQGDPISSQREIERLVKDAERRLPLVLKSARAVHGHSTFVIHQTEDLGNRLSLWVEQLRRDYGEVLLFAERYLEGARYIVVPFARFQDGKTEIFPLVDASLQSRNHKIVEMCPAEPLEQESVELLSDWTRKFMREISYVGVGTLEFLVDGTRAFFIDGQPGLNTSYDLWQRVAGTDAVAWQLAASTGARTEPFPSRQPRKEWTYGLSLRLYAEDSLLQLPQPGVVQEASDRKEWKFPGAEAEVSLSITSGSEVRYSDDGFLGTITVGAQNRKQAFTVARGVLDESWIAGSLQTNERFLSELISHPWVKEGIFHAGFVDEEFVPEIRPSAETMRVFASICQSLAEEDSGARWVVGDQWVKPDAASLRWQGAPRLWKQGGFMGCSGVVELSEGQQARVCAFPVLPDRWQVRIGAWTLPVRKLPPATQTKTPVRHRLTALVSGKVHAVLFQENASVPAHEPLVIVESLGTLVPHALPLDVSVVKWRTRAEDLISAGQELAEFEPAPLHTPSS